MTFAIFALQVSWTQTLVFSLIAAISSTQSVLEILSDTDGPRYESPLTLCLARPANFL